MATPPRGPAPPLREAFRTPAHKRRYVARLFATIADRYDLITVVLSYGQDRRWKKRLLDLARPAPGARALDLACGTGDLAYGLAAREVWTVGLDLTPRMLELAQAKRRQSGEDGRPHVRFLAGDMMRLPFVAGVFDLVTVGYGLRNVPEVGVALDEIRRVLKPGGRLLSLDFDRPERAWLRRLYLGYLTVAGSTLGLVLHGDPDTYRYIPASIRHYEGARRLVERLRERGFVETVWIPVLGGLMAIHVAQAGEPSSVPEANDDAGRAAR